MSNNELEILLVEDNENDAELTMRAFRKHRLLNCIKHVKDGEEALEFILCKGRYSERDSSEKPTFVLLDLKLPKVSGLEVLKEIREHEETKFLPVVMLTSSSEERDMIDSYKLGVNSYITKPVEFDKFIDSVSRIGYYWILLNKQPHKD